MADPSLFRFIDLSGTKVFRLKVISLHSLRKGVRFWLCRCECGNEVAISTARLRNGTVMSCGCARTDRARAWMASPEFIASHTKYKNAMTRDERLTYRSWESMIQRCYNEKSPQFSSYGGRGITVCLRWQRKGFDNFVEDVGKRPSLLHTLDREDVNGNYEKDNCRWATRSEQSRNRTNSIRLMIFGSYGVLQDAIDLGIVSGTQFRYRIKKFKESPQDALNFFLKQKGLY